MDRIALLSFLALGAGLATGCANEDQEAFDEFARVEAELRCEIADFCGEFAPWECGAAQTHDFDRCDDFREEFARDCLDDLESTLASLHMVSPADVESSCNAVTWNPSCYVINDESPAPGVSRACDAP